jgi:hypothetical protein
MSWGGDLLTFFRFHYARIEARQVGELFHFDLATDPDDSADIHASYDLSRAAHTLPSSSAFASLRQSKEFLVELFAAFAVEPRTQQVRTVRIARGPWDVCVVPDLRARYMLMQAGGLFPAGATRLDSIFYVHDIPYYWHSLD